MRRDAAIVLDVERRDAVEPVAAHPQDECVERLEDHRLLWHRAHAAVLREAARARSDDRRADQRRDAARHVHDTQPAKSVRPPSNVTSEEFHAENAPEVQPMCTIGG